MRLPAILTAGEVVLGLTNSEYTLLPNEINRWKYDLLTVWGNSTNLVNLANIFEPQVLILNRKINKLNLPNLPCSFRTHEWDQFLCYSVRNNWGILDYL